MFWWGVLQVVSLLTLYVCPLLAYEDNIDVNYGDNYFNEISVLYTPEATPEPEPEPEPTATPCRSKDLTKWDKLFSMLENSQMRENMLLQYVDDIIKVEMGSLREELARSVAPNGACCGAAVESAGKSLASQLEDGLKKTLERLRVEDRISAAAGNSVAAPDNLESLLTQLLSAAQAQSARLAKLESSCAKGQGAGKGGSRNGGFPGGAKIWEQEVMPLEEPLDEALVEVRQSKAELEEALRSMRRRNLPAGCEMALLFPMRSRRIFTSIIPDAPLSISSFTACMWVKPTVTANKTVLLSYGNRHNPYEIQLLLGQGSALLTVGGEAHLVEARGVATSGEWLHLCGAWSSVHGMATLWVGGQKVASTPGVAEGHVLPDGGALQLGQERNGCCGMGVEGFETSFDRQLAFAGKMTGVNLWDRVLSGEEISQLAQQDGQGCEQRGNIVAWGTTEMVPHAGAQFVY